MSSHTGEAAGAGGGSGGGSSSMVVDTHILRELEEKARRVTELTAEVRGLREALLAAAVFAAKLAEQLKREQGP